MEGKNPKATEILAIGMAMFSMFFGSGNIVFPVLIGQYVQGTAPFAIAGLLLTAVVLPFFGLVSISTYQGDYLSYFSRLGKIPGWFIIILIMSLIGPFAVLPRCIIISYAAFKTFLPQIELIPFSLVCVVLIYLCTFKRSRVIEILGKYLTPFLLLSLIAIIVKGILTMGQVDPGPLQPSEAVLFGLVEGYNTMDIFASFMFASVVLSSIITLYPDRSKNQRFLLKTNLKAGAIGMGFLAAIYTGMCIVASFHGVGLEGVPSEQLLAQLTLRVLGSSAGLVVCVAVSLACLTTAISLAMVFSEFTSKQLFKEKVSYRKMLLLTLSVSFCMSTLEFSGIQGILVPILKITLPCLVLLAFLNFAYKVFGFKPVKIPVFLSLIGSLYFYFFS